VKNWNWKLIGRIAEVVGIALAVTLSVVALFNTVNQPIVQGGGVQRFDNLQTRTIKVFNASDLYGETVIQDGGVLTIKSGGVFTTESGSSVNLGNVQAQVGDFTSLHATTATIDTIEYVTKTSALRIEAEEIIGGYVEAGEFRTSTTATFDDGANVTGTLRVNTVNPLTGNSVIVSAGTATGTVYARDNLAVGVGMPPTLNGGDLWAAGDIYADGSISGQVVTATSRVVLKAANSCAGGNLPLQMAGDADTGICSETSNYLNLCVGGDCSLQIGSGGLYLTRNVTTLGQSVWGMDFYTLTGSTIITPSANFSVAHLHAASPQNVTLFYPNSNPFLFAEYMCLTGSSTTASISIQVAQSGGGSVRNLTGNPETLGPYDVICYMGIMGEWRKLSGSANQ